MMKLVPIPKIMDLTNIRKMRNFARYYFKIVKTTPNAYTGQNEKRRLRYKQKNQKKL